MITLNLSEVDALVRSLDGLGDIQTVELSRRDSFDNEHPDGFLIVAVNWADGGRSADAISEVGSTTIWTHRAAEVTQ
jgi:hypothetical protein